MAIWRTNTTSTDEAEPTFLQKAQEKTISVGWSLIKFLVLVLFLLAELCSVPKVSDLHANESDIQQEMRDLVRKGATKELELDSSGDIELYANMMSFVRTMRFGDFELEGDKAQEFWNACAPDKSDTTLEYIHFDSERNHVLLRYTNGISAEIIMEFDSQHFCKAVTLRYGVFNGNLLKWIYWNLIGRFVSGYPRYVSEADTNGNDISDDVTLKKYSIRNQVFSWSWNPDTHKHNESISDYWE